MTSVLLTTDGTYPCYRGGVSVWCDQLIRQLPEKRFHCFAITYSPSNVPLFEAPTNLASLNTLPLWGTAEPGPQPTGLLDALSRRFKTTPARIQQEFVPPFETLLRCVMGSTDAPHFARALLALHTYFDEHDYSSSVTSPEAWESFIRIAREQEMSLTLEDATRCMRWLQRYLAVAAVRFPQTDVVHSSMAGLAGVPGVLQKLRFGSGFLLTEHGIYLRELYLSLAQMKVSTPCRRFLFRWFECIVHMNYHYADQVTSLCEFNRRWQIRMGADTNRIRIVPNGIDPARFRPPDTPRRPAAPVVLTMARIYRLKGIDHLLPAIRLVLDEVPEARFRILGEVGDVEYAKHCLALAHQLGISGNIGWGQTHDAPSAYRQADVFCLPSISEAMPYSILEAMFSGCPVVATDVGGVAEMLQGTGLVVPPRNPQTLARALLSLLSGDGATAYREELASRALLRARTHYDVEHCTRLFRDTYGQLSRQSLTAVLAG